MKKLRVTLIQTDIIQNSIQSNLDTLKNRLLSYKSDSDLIVLPEYFTTGFTRNPSAFAESMDGRTIKWMKEIAAEKQSAVTGGTIINDKGRIYNRLVFINKNGYLSFYDKRHLFKIGGEERDWSKGRKRMIAGIEEWKICPLICYDLRFPVWSRYKGDYDLLVYVASWPADRIDIWKTLLKARAIENQAYVIGANRVGSDSKGTLYSGNSLIYGPQGQIITEFETDKERIDTFILSYKKLKDLRNKFPALQDADDFEILTDNK